MTTFTQVWNAAFEAIPADTDDASEGALRIRNLKRDLRERLDVRLAWAGDANDGQFDVVPLAGGTANAITATLGVSAYVTGSVYSVRIASTNTGAVTLALDGLSALAVQTIFGNALIGSELRSPLVANFLYDGTNFRLLNPLPITEPDFRPVQEWIFDGNTAPALFNLGTLAAVTNHLVGPTGTTNAWPALDVLPLATNAIKITVKVTVVADTANGIWVRAAFRENGSSLDLSTLNAALHSAMEHREGSATADTFEYQSNYIWVPVDANNRFEARWARLLGSSAGFQMFLALAGFSVDN